VRPPVVEVDVDLRLAERAVGVEVVAVRDFDVLLGGGRRRGVRLVIVGGVGSRTASASIRAQAVLRAPAHAAVATSTSAASSGTLPPAAAASVFVPFGAAASTTRRSTSDSPIALVVKELEVAGRLVV
jgi:hypothetical protein